MPFQLDPARGSTQRACDWLWGGQVENLVQIVGTALASSRAEGFPWWLKWISVVDPFTYTVHALRNLTLKNTGIAGIYKDVLILIGFSVIMISGCIALFKRQI